MYKFLGIDSSTTGVKALLCDEQGTVIGTASSELPLSTPKPLWSEQDPTDWWNGTVNSIRQVLAQTGISGEEIAAIGLTGQMHGMTMLDANGEVLRPAMLWNDQRTGPQCDDIRARLGKKRLVKLTGNDALTGFTAPKILWVREHEPDIYAQAKQILLPKDYIRYMLTGEYATDKAGAAGTLLLNVTTRDWSQEVLDALEIPREWMPKTYEGSAVTGQLSATAAEATGLKIGTPVVGGGGDQAAQAVGVGAVEAGIIALTLGTSGVIFASADQPFVEPEGRMHAFCHAVPKRWHMMGVMLSAAGSLRWYRDTFAPDTDFGDLLIPANDVPIGSEGLLFLPYLTGERTPHPDPFARGGFVGITIRHTRAHFTRAVIEGVSFGLRDGFELMKGAGLTDIKQVRVSGGGSKSPLWRQILADVLQVELVTVNTTEGAAYGAALLAGVGAGTWSTVDEACQAGIELTGSTKPTTEGIAAYELFYAQYRELYPALKDISHALGQVV
ncbi:xylulokinase [Anaerolineales bacterium HSG24]|nr:xylulokinase [Anaerolineales bacterium HSG24]